MNPQDPIVVLNRLRKILDLLLKPEVLEGLVKLKEELGEENDMLGRWEYFCEHGENGEKCHYAKLSKHYFLEMHGDNVINLICWLNDNWASLCKKE